MGRRKKVVETEVQEIEFNSNEELPTFAQAKGTEANQHAKKLAKAKSKKQKESGEVFYTQKGVKVLKVIFKPNKLISVFIANNTAAKHKEALAPMIKKWKAEGVWLTQDQFEAKKLEKWPKEIEQDEE